NYTLERDPRVAPQADLMAAIVDREEKARKEAVSDAWLRDVSRPDIDVSEVGVRDLNVRGTTLRSCRGARKNERVGRGRVDDRRNDAAVDRDVDHRVVGELVDDHQL